MKTPLLLGCAVLFACGGQEATPSRTATIDVPEAGPAPLPPAMPAATSGATAAAASPAGPPPIGTWDITMEMRTNTCPAPDGGMSPRDAMLVTLTANLTHLIPLKRTKDGKLAGNVPVSPDPRMFAQHRNDVVLEVGHVAKASIKPDHSCAYELQREIEVKEVGAERIVLLIRSDYGDPKGCARVPSPGLCKSEAVMTYTLARKLCEPGCAFPGGRTLLDGGVEGKCVCPDGGGP